VERRLAAIGRFHRAAGHDPPPTRDLIVQKAMASIRRSVGTDSGRSRNPLDARELDQMLTSIDPAPLVGRRDRALLLLGFHLALGPAELVALDVEDVAELNRDPLITVRRSKPGQAVRRLRQSDPSAAALEAWLQAARIVDGALWRRLTRWGTVAGRLSAQSVNLIIKRACSRADIDPRQYSGDSLRLRPARR
jgi:integrase